MIITAPFRPPPLRTAIGSPTPAPAPTPTQTHTPTQTQTPTPTLRFFSNLTTDNLHNDMNHFINIGTPLINNIIGNSNIVPILNATEINNNVNTLFENLNPFFTAFSTAFNATRSEALNNSNSSDINRH